MHDQQVLFRNDFLPNFSPRLIGVPFNKTSARSIVDFIDQFNGNLKIYGSVLQYNLTQETYDYIKRFERDNDLSRFYQLVRTIGISCLIEDVNFFNKFNRCEQVVFFSTRKSEILF